MDFGSPKRGFGHPKSDSKRSSQQISWKRWKYYKTSEIMKHTSSKIHCFRSPNLAKICSKLGSETGPSINRVFVVSCLDLGGYWGVNIRTKIQLKRIPKQVQKWNPPKTAVNLLKMAATPSEPHQRGAAFSFSWSWLLQGRPRTRVLSYY